MDDLTVKLTERTARKNRKRNERKREIAASAMEALKQLGYANTTLRDIAAKSDLSLGMLHYYFEDKIELITYCVENYKAEFIHDLSLSIEHAKDRDELVASFSEALVASIIDDEAIHRLWYDIRTQAMFDPLFRPVVARIEKSLIGLVNAAVMKAGTDAGGRIDILYAMLDGVFRFVMQSQVTGRAMTRKQMQQLFRELLDQFL
ncbi:MAG: TetR/AcrR family transcriptional regulator [Nitratireductor sp.]